MTIELRQVGFAYGRAPVLEDVTCTARPGTVTALVGPNAAGKTTLLRLVTGALVPGRGFVTVGGRAPHRLGGHVLASTIAYVAQRPRVAAAFTVREVVELGRCALPRRQRRVDDALDRLDLAAIADRPWPALSVGQQQRVAVARALAQLAPDGCLVLDEPSASMDLRHARQTHALLRDLAAGGATVLVALHDLAAAARLADDAWLLERRPPGRLRAAGAVAGVLEPVVLEEVFGVPFEWITRPGGGRLLAAVEGEPCGGTAGIAPS